MTGSLPLDYDDYASVGGKGAGMIIVEGPDGGGKTRLARRLSRDLGLTLAPRIVRSDTTSTIESLKEWVEENVRTGFQPVIFDRHRLISEPIYGPLMRRGLRDGFDDQIWFHRWWHLFMATGPMVIWCLPKLEVVVENCMSDPDNEVVRDHIETIYWQYWSMMCRWPMYGVHWNYMDQDEDYSFLTKLIQRHIERMTP